MRVTLTRTRRTPGVDPIRGQLSYYGDAKSQAILWRTALISIQRYTAWMRPVSRPTTLGRDTGRADRSSGESLLLSTGFAGVLFILTFLVLGVLAPNYDSMRETISATELTSLGTAQRVNFFLFGLLLCAFAVALRRELKGGRGELVIPAFQMISGIGAIGDAIFIHYPLHLVCDLIAFNATLIVLFAFAWVFRGKANWAGWSAYSIATALLMVVLLTAFGFANHAGGPAGFFEKCATVTRTSWSVLFTSRLLRGVRL